jgi:hypothetical protein
MVVVAELVCWASRYNSIVQHVMPPRAALLLEGVMNLDAEEVASWHGYSKTIPK